MDINIARDIKIGSDSRAKLLKGVKQIADAVRDGASRATITMDGGKVSSRLQTPMIVNTLPGV